MSRVCGLHNRPATKWDNPNPFEELESASVANKERRYFLSRQDARKVLDACPDAEWRLLFSLARFGGLRTPSETLLLRWSDIHGDRITVTGPKTERFEGKGSRVIPLFPELRPYLEEAFEQAEPGAEYVITRYRRANSNLRTQLQRIIKRAGLKPWPRLFQNLRSSCETELAASHPIHVVTAWIGNTPEIARKHYLQVRDEDFDRATHAQVDVGPCAQNAAQFAAKQGCTVQQITSEPDPAVSPFPVRTDACKLTQVLAGQRGGERDEAEAYESAQARTERVPAGGMEPMRFELTTSCMPCKRSPN